MNFAPILVGSISDVTYDEGAQITALNISGNFSELDGDFLIYSATGLPDGLLLNPSTGIITGRPDNAQVSSEVVITATDLNLESLSVSQSFI